MLHNLFHPIVVAQSGDSLPYGLGGANHIWQAGSTPTKPNRRSAYGTQQEAGAIRT
ncbi:hypothetical protein EV192_1432, partial [Actinocrispum wychmicini]